MTNKVRITNITDEVQFSFMPIGTLFRSQFPVSEENVYMKIQVMQFNKGVMLKDGIVYDFPCDKIVIPLRRGQAVFIEQM